MTGDAPLRLDIQGHTDDSGSPEHNAKLSGDRAASVKDWLVAHGIAASRLTSKGTAPQNLSRTITRRRGKQRTAAWSLRGCSQPAIRIPLSTVLSTYSTFEHEEDQHVVCGSFHPNIDDRREV